MGKMVSIYLTDEEQNALKRFCEENHCTQYSALKTALKELVSRPPHDKEEETRSSPENKPVKADPANTGKTEKYSILQRLLKSAPDSAKES